MLAKCGSANGTRQLTLVFRVEDEFSDHGLDDTYISIKETTNNTAKKGNPKIGGQTHDKKGRNGSKAANKQDWLAPYPI